MRHWKKKPWVDSEVRNWDYIADHLAPDASSADAGKVLTVGETGKPEWGAGGGSGGVLYGPYTAFVEANPEVMPLPSMDKTELFTYTEYYDANGNKVIFPEENLPVCSGFTIEIYSSGVALCALTMQKPLVYVINVTDSAISELFGAVTFYTDRPLEPAEA